MTDTHAPVPAPPARPLRLWPAIAVGALLCVRYAIPIVSPANSGLAMLIGVVGALLVLVWWLLFSRAPWALRFGAIGVIVLMMAATSRVIHPSIAGGMMGMMFPIYAIQGVSLALVVWAVASRRFRTDVQYVLLIAAIAVASGAWILLRTDGILSGGAQLTWRWIPTAEQRLLAAEPVPVDPSVPPPAAVEPTAHAEPARGAASATSAVAPMTESAADWPGFRGPARDNVIRGVRIETDWVKSPPVALWRRSIGPGWSSFAVKGDLLYTQEQRGDDEVVACYRVSTGKPVWMHRDATRFWESNAGPGPRGTPAVSQGRVYAFGATGVLNALDAGTGALVWTRNAAAETGATTPGWGFSSSPLVTGDVVVVAVSGQLVAYDAASGTPRWRGPVHGVSYSSPHLVTIDGVAQVVLLSAAGATSIAPADGTVLWEHAWPGGAIVQPAMTTEGDLLINSIGMTGGQGIRRLAVTHRAAAPDSGSGPGAGWTAEERWTSNGLKPYFNDFVVHRGHAFGFDGSILACIDLADGKRTWKGGRYGEGQLVLLPDQDLLLVLSEDGELALVQATADRFTEVARAPAIEGKTWNHPVVVGDILLVRNGEQMAAFRLSLGR